MFGMPVRNCSTWFRVVASAGALLTWAANAVHAAPALPEGSKSITLISEAGGKLDLGHIEFKKDGDGATFEVTLANPEFHDEFLSMRPFQCLGGVKEMWCHLVYPYDLKRRITADDLADLEYSLLFLFKPPATLTMLLSAIPTLNDRSGNAFMNGSVRVELPTSASTTTTSGCLAPKSFNASPNASRVAAPNFKPLSSP